MAYDNDQNEFALPAGDNERRRSAQHLPKYFRTDVNRKFLASTIDQLLQPGTAEKLNGYFGRKYAKGYKTGDFYIGDVSKGREDYQFEPVSLIEDELDNVTFYGNYNDYINQVRNLDGNVADHSLLNRQEYYSWNPHIDWDKFVNFREYYWLPNGPQTVPVFGQTVDVESTYTVTAVDNGEHYGYVFTPDGHTQNPELTLYRGITYKFEVNAPGNPLSIRTRKADAYNWAPGRFYDVGNTVIYNGTLYVATSTHQSVDFDADSGYWELDTTFNLVGQVSQQHVEKGTIEVTLDNSTPDLIYYQSDSDIYASGLIRVKDISEATYIDVENEILGKKTYATADFAFSNGMKVEFKGTVIPEKYALGAWYVEGVGKSIKLVSEEELNVPSSFTEDLLVAFDTEGFDRFPYSEAIGYPVNKDYITINRASPDGNLWSKYNRWFHKSVIELAETINGQQPELDQTARATRPIIEFEAGLKLFNFGTSVKKNVDLVDNFTTDVFSTIEGSQGYSVDGVDLTNGMRVLFTADPDSLVKGKIYDVKFVTINNNRQISLVEADDSIPLENETVLCKDGTLFKGKILWYNGEDWVLAQDKTAVNQSPRFDVYDCQGNNYADTSVYESSTFTGTHVFSYAVGAGANDNELGFPLKYRSIENVGDIVFHFDLLSDSMTYCPFSAATQEMITGLGYIRRYKNREEYEVLNGWQKAEELSTQSVIRQYDVDNTRTYYPIDVYDRSGTLTDLWVRVYLNNELLFENVDYTIITDVQDRAAISFIKTVTKGDVVVIKTRSSAPKNDNGLYEIPASLERNPLNADITEFTLGEVNDHVGTIIEESNNFLGLFPGTSNLRDLGNVSQYGKRIVKHSAPLNLPLYHLLDKDANLVKSIKYARREYGKFKRLFLQLATDLTFDGSVKDHVDNILLEMVKDKVKTMPFYFSDMVPFGAAVQNTFEIEDADLIYFALSKAFDINTLSDKAVQIYQNGVQLVYGKDYTFNDQGFAIVTTEKAIGDVVEIYEYETTNGCYVPPTPTKLGLYPKYEPSLFIDNTYLESQTVIQGHDGSITIAYGDYRDDLILELEKRIYNNLKVSYDADLFDIYDYVPSDYRNTGLSKTQLDDTMISDFVQWLQLTDEDYTLNPTYLRENTFTVNHKNMISVNDEYVSGYWRAVYIHAYDTDRPHTHPWEMLGFTIKPTWWDEQYGEAPYTSNNFLMWEDIEAGIIREPNVLPVVNEKFVRPGLSSHLPVDEDGNLVSPIISGFIKEYNTIDLDANFEYGDHSPVETAWRRSGEYPFALMAAIFLNQPARAIATGFDRSRQQRGIVGDIIYNAPNRQLRLTDIQFPNSVDAKTRTYTSGFVNYVYDYLASKVTVTYESYIGNLQSINNRMGFRLAGYTSKDKFKLILDSRTPLNEGNVFIPDENYKVILSKSTPIRNVYYSGVIIEKQPNGFVVRGYNNEQPYFTYTPAISLANDTLINIGGISQSFVYWTTGKTYTKGQIIEFENSYYRTSESHTSGEDFDGTKFAKLPQLPLVGGREAYFRKRYSNKLSVLPYGSVLRTIQEVVDFLLGYGNYLEEQGFVFDYYSGDNEFVADWKTSAKEFMFWTTQNWAQGAVITLSPGAFQLKFNSNYAVVDDIYDTFYGYKILKADGKKLEPNYVSLTRENPREFIIKTKSTEDGIYSVRLSLVQKEHAVLIDNTTVFGDVIYDQAPGYRQERIRVLGYRTSDWDGSINIPGFVFDNAIVTEWEPWQDYSIGELVKYKEFYYTARNKISGTEVFNATQWVRLNEKPEMGLIPNWEYKTNQFTDFYDLDTDNFDIEQQKFAQHLIGYQNRDYLANIINDDVSQYKFYQGMIQDKGTRNALTKLFDALGSTDKDSLEFYEEWAIKVGQYGAADGFEEVEYILDESKMRLEPQSFELVNSVSNEETDLVYRILPYEAYLKPSNYNHAPFPGKYNDSTYVKNSGYVNPEDVDFIVTTYDAIANINFLKCAFGNTIWVGNDGLDWAVYTHIRTDLVVEAAEKIDETTTSLILTSTPKYLNVGEFIGVFNVTGLTQSFYKITSISKNVINITATINESVTDIDGRVTRLVNVRLPDVKAANNLLESIPEGVARLWIDNDNTSWQVINSSERFAEHQVVTNSDLGAEHGYGLAVAADAKNTVLAVGSPDNNNGKVFIYTRAGNASSYQLVQEIEAEDGLSDALQRFGASLAMSEDGKFLAVGSPNASNVKSKFLGEWDETTDYPTESIVRYQDALWRAETDIEGSETSIKFDSFESVTQILTDLGITETEDESVPVILTGNYPFTNVDTDHILIRAPFAMYEGTAAGDQILTRWNVNSNSYQTTENTVNVQPFGGNIPAITNATFNDYLSILDKIDVVLYVDEVNTVPLVGQRVEIGNAFGTVAYTYTPTDLSTVTANTTIYLKDTNGSFGTAGSLTTDIGEYVGEYVTAAPVGTTSGLDDRFGGFWLISVPEYNNGSYTSDEGRGLVYYNAITLNSVPGDSSSLAYYHNILDYKTTAFSSYDTRNSELSVLTYEGTPNNVDGIYKSPLYVLRGPKDLTDSLNIIDVDDPDNDTVNLYYNSLAEFEKGEWEPNTYYNEGDVLRYETSSYSNIYWRVRFAHTSADFFLTLDEDTGVFEYDINRYEPLSELPWQNPADLNLPISTLNGEHVVYDLWDGYFDVYLTKKNPADESYIEPYVGLTVKDVTNRGEAVITFYQRFDTRNVRIYVKGVTGRWALGNVFGENREIAYLSDPTQPEGSLYNPKIGQQTFGQIESRSIGYDPAGIGKLIVLKDNADIELPATTTFLDVEYWLYNIVEIDGIPRDPNVPAENNNDWLQVYNTPAVISGTASGLDHEGMYHIYERRGVGQFVKVSSYTVPERVAFNRLGSSLKFGFLNGLYRLFVKAAGNNNEILPGRIYTIKNGTENEYSYGWDLGKDKEYKGEFSDLRDYFENDIVYYDNVLYQANTNIAAGAFDLTDWTVIEGTRSYVGYIPNSTGLNVHDSSRLVGIDSTILDQGHLINFARDFDVSADGEVLVASVTYTQDKPTQIAVYRNYNGHYELSQTIAAPSNTIDFGISVSISADGRMIAVGAPAADITDVDQGAVYVYAQTNGVFELSQTLTSAENDRAEAFGYRVSCDGNRLVVVSKNGDAYIETTYDTYSRPLTGYTLDSNSTLTDRPTTFDKGFTKFRNYDEDTGVAKIYQRIGDTVIFGHAIDFDQIDANYFGQNITLSNNHIYVGLPKFAYNSSTRTGTVVDYRIPDATTIWSELRTAKQTVDVNKIKRVMLYDTKTNDLIQYLDYVDVLQGKIPGPAEQELSYKTYFDPATYTTGVGVNIDPLNSWGRDQVGKLWWDLTKAKYKIPYQSNVIFSSNNWNSTFSSINTIDVYEWVESKYLPSEWDSLNGTEQGVAQGITGTTRYGDDVYVTKRVYDDATDTFTTYFYYWVLNKTTLPNIEERTISANQVSNLIADPAGEGYRFISFISPTQFALHNCTSLIRGNDVAISVQYWTIEDQDINIHNQYQIITEGLESSKPNRDIEQKWFDSLVGVDSANRPVPAPELSPKERYGILNRPRQGWFVNRTEALKQTVTRINNVLENNLIVDNKDISALTQVDLPPSASSNRYDRTVDAYIDLQFVGVAKATQAVLTPIVEDGKIVRVTIDEPGRGYLTAPIVTVLGTGQDAVITTVINNLGQVVDVVIENSGEYYDNNTRLSTRRFTVLVKADETLSGKWTLYERDAVAKEWVRVESQAFDVTRYWEYIDWYDDGYSAFTEVDHLIDYSYDLTSVTASVGDIVKIQNVGTGGWLLLEKIDSQIGVDYTINYKTVGRQNGTLQFLTNLYDTTSSLVGYDTTSYDVLLYDSLPTTETRIILETIRDKIFTDDLEVEYNNLFFASLRYVFSEQSYVDWAFKTSFVKAQHNVGNLEQKISFQNDNLPSYEKYVKEVKPYKTKIREYLSAYEKLENSQTMTTDFDLPPRFVRNEAGIQPQKISVLDDQLIVSSAEIETYPNKHWADNAGYKVLRIEIADPGAGYTSNPAIEIQGDSGSRATAVASIGRNGTVNAINVVTSGNGYLSAPTVVINGSIADGGREAKAVAIIGDSPVRTMHTVVKFDRVSGVYEFVSLATTETFTTSGNTEVFNLEWPMDMRTSRVAVYLDNDEVLGGRYTYRNVLDTSKGYDRYQGQIDFNDPPVNGQELRVEYYKDISMLDAQDRINLAYEPSSEQFGKTLGQLMDGVDYGGVEVRSFDFSGTTGWDADPWFVQGWDIYDTTFEDEIIRLDGSTIEFELSKPLENGVVYNVYKNGVRLDDPNFGTEAQTNDDAVMPSITGDGTTTTIVINDYDIEGNDGDVFIVRKVNSDGAFLPDPESYDTLLQGGDLAYSTATGLDATSINIDGDGFVTPTTSKGPEEVVPGQVLDTVDITVYERPTGGTGEIISRNYKGDGSTKTYDLGIAPVKGDNLFVKVDYSILTTDSYTIDYANNTVTFDTAPGDGDPISILNLGNSAANILDIDTFVGDGTTNDVLTNARWEDDIDAFVTVNGVETPVELIKADDTYEYPNNVIVRFPTPVKLNAVINVMLTVGANENYVQYSQVTIDTFIADGSTTTFNLADSTVPFEQTPTQFYTIVKVNDTVLNAGYSEKFIVEDKIDQDYQFDLTQVPVASLNYYDLDVYLNGRKLEYLQEWTYEGAGGFDSTQPAQGQPGSTITLERGIAEVGDELTVFVISNGEYRYGYFDNNEFVNTPNTLHLDSGYNENDVITVYQFSNHNSQGIERYTLEVTEKTELTPGTDLYYKYGLLERGLIGLRNAAVDTKYVWVAVDGNLLTPDVDYAITENKRYVQLVDQPVTGSKIEVIHFADRVVTNKFGWRQFKDMLNRTHYKRLDDVYTLAEDLNWYDKSIEVVDATGLPQPEYNAKYPGIIFINGERIEFFNRTGNTLNQLRRGTLGTGVKEVYLAGTKFVEQGVDTNMPYRDETEVITVTADGTSATFDLPFDSDVLDTRYGNAKDLVEVFVGGTRLRKDPVQVFNKDIALDSPEGDETHVEEFTISSNILTLATAPEEGIKISIIRKIGRPWTEAGTALANADSDVARFLRDKTTDLPR